MFLVDCPHCSTRSLGSWSALAALHNGESGIQLVLRCPSCGRSHVARTGRPRAESTGRAAVA